MLGVRGRRDGGGAAVRAERDAAMARTMPTSEVTTTRATAPWKPVSWAWNGAAPESRREALSMP